MTDRDTPLAGEDVAVLRRWADAQPAHATVSVYSLQRALATVVQLRRQLREARAAEDAAWGLLIADLTLADPTLDIPPGTP